MDEFRILIARLPEHSLLQLIAKMACELAELGLLTDIERRQISREIEVYNQKHQRAAA